MVYLPKKWGIIVHLLLFLPKKYPFLPKKCTFMAVSSEEIPLFCTFMVISSEEINVISSEIMSKNSSFQPFQKIFEVLLSWFSHKKFNLYKNVHLCVFFPKKYPFPVQLRQYLPKKSEEMGYNCTFIAISSEEIPFSSEEILRSGHEKSDILSNIASKQISKIIPFSGWGSLGMKTI